MLFPAHWSALSVVAACLAPALQLTSRLAQYGRLAAVPAPAESFGLLPLFLGEASVVLPTLRFLAPGLFVLPAVLAFVVSFV